MLNIKIERYESYITFATCNFDAVYFYRGLGYDALNTITIRKDFHPEQLENRFPKNMFLNKILLFEELREKIAIK